MRSARATFGDDCSFWPTPTATDRGYYPDLQIESGKLRYRSPVEMGKESGGQFPLSLTANSWTTLWLVLRALGWNAEATSRSSHPLRVTFKRGKGYSTGDLISNPRFYEAIMGWPIGWTEPGASVTGFAAWLQRSRSALSRLTSALAEG